MRVGIGHDTHRLAAGRPLRLGGVRLDHARGLVGHSDADVVLHALTDALLGAAGLGDIGDAYPDTDPAYSGCDSSIFLRETLARLNQGGWRVVNVDVIFGSELLRIQVRDDGIGFAGDAKPFGRGMGNMRSRARKIGGTLRVGLAGPGASIGLDVPLSAICAAPSALRA